MELLKKILIIVCTLQLVILCSATENVDKGAGLDKEQKKSSKIDKKIESTIFEKVTTVNNDTHSDSQNKYNIIELENKLLKKQYEFNELKTIENQLRVDYDSERKEFESFISRMNFVATWGITILTLIFTLFVVYLTITSWNIRAQKLELNTIIEESKGSLKELNTNKKKSEKVIANIIKETDETKIAVLNTENEITNMHDDYKIKINKLDSILGLLDSIGLKEILSLDENKINDIKSIINGIKEVDEKNYSAEEFICESKIVDNAISKIDIEIGEK